MDNQTIKTAIELNQILSKYFLEDFEAEGQSNTASLENSFVYITYNDHIYVFDTMIDTSTKLSRLLGEKITHAFNEEFNTNYILF